MENKNLDNFFKERASQFNEQPGDALWAKIESGLDVPAANKPAAKGGISLGKWLLILSGVAGIIILAIILIPTEWDVKTSQPEPEIQQTAATAATATEALTTPSDTVKTNTIVLIPVKPVNNATPTRSLAPNRIEDTITPGSMPDVAVATTKPAPQPKKIKISVKESPKRTVLTVREKISQQKFDSIVTASLTQYKDKVGMQLIVKGFKGMIYRGNIRQQGEASSPRDSIKTQPKNKLAVTARLVTTTNGIANESAEFTPKYDSVTDTYYVQYDDRDRGINEPVYTVQLTVQPEFPGGITELNSFIYKNFRLPHTDIDIDTKIHVSFVIETDGSISNIKVRKDPGYGLGAEAVRVLKLLTTKWKPGEIHGKIVRTAYFIPITVSNRP